MRSPPRLDHGRRPFRARPGEILYLDLQGAAFEVAVERFRQIKVEGWSKESDDRHADGEMIWAARCYVAYAGLALAVPPAAWPWDPKWWRPRNARRDLVRAGALALAEVSRLIRARRDLWPREDREVDRLTVCRAEAEAFLREVLRRIARLDAMGGAQ